MFVRLGCPPSSPDSFGAPAYPLSDIAGKTLTAFFSASLFFWPLEICWEWGLRGSDMGVHWQKLTWKDFVCVNRSRCQRLFSGQMSPHTASLWRQRDERRQEETETLKGKCDLAFTSFRSEGLWSSSHARTHTHTHTHTQTANKPRGTCASQHDTQCLKDISRCVKTHTTQHEPRNRAQIHKPPNTTLEF